MSRVEVDEQKLKDILAVYSGTYGVCQTCIGHSACKKDSSVECVDAILNSLKEV